MIGGKETNQVKYYNANNIFFLHFVLSQICDDRSEHVSAVRHDVIIYHPFPIISQYLKTWGVNSSAKLSELFAP